MVSSGSFSPARTSSRKISSCSSSTNTTNTRNSDRRSKTRTSASSVFELPKKTNLRIMNVNCQCLGSKKEGLAAAIQYIKPDIVCGTESWLRGIKPAPTPPPPSPRRHQVNRNAPPPPPPPHPSSVWSVQKWPKHIRRRCLHTGAQVYYVLGGTSLRDWLRSRVGEGEDEKPTGLTRRSIVHTRPKSKWLQRTQQILK